MSGPASAETYKCVRTSISSNGFVNRQAAESWFPAIVEFQVRGDRVRSHFYGDGEVKRTKNGRLQFYFFNEVSKRSVTYTYIPKSGRYGAKLGAYGRYAATQGARGKCQAS